MTVQQLIVPIVVTLGLYAIAAVVVFVFPPWLSLLVRVGNGFVLVAATVWLVRHMLEARKLLVEHRKEILRIIEESGKLASAVAKRAEVQAEAVVSQTRVIEEKLDTVIQQQTQERERTA